jgi:hypothetical protein
MATEASREIEIFYEFLGHQIQEGSVDLSPEDCVEAFRSYQRDLDRLKQKLRWTLTGSSEVNPAYLSMRRM